VLFFFQQEQVPLFTLSSLMSGAGQKLSVLVASHFLPALFDDAPHSLTSFHNIVLTFKSFYAIHLLMVLQAFSSETKGPWKANEGGTGTLRSGSDPDHQ
jgi:hypothetical protein